MALVHIIAGIPGLTNPTALGALFSLTATGLYTSYLIPILLRVTVSRDSFQPAEFSLGKYSVPMGIISVTWASFMIITLCLPQDAPITINNMNYSPIALGIVLISAFFSWIVSARHWFKGAHRTVPHRTSLTYSPLDCNAVKRNRPLHLPYAPSSFFYLNNCFLHCQE
jgi:amino acid transporter